MIKYVHRFIITIFVVLVTTFASHANSEKCLRALATDLVNTIEQNVDTENDNITISSDGLIEFFTTNIDSCREYLLNRTSEENILINEDGLTMDVNWDYILEEVTAALTVTGDQRQIYVCENNRSEHALLETVLWVPTIVSAVFSFGTAGIAATAAKEGAKAGFKSLIKVGVTKGGLATAKAVATKAAAGTATAKLGIEVAGKKAAQEAAEKTLKEASEKITKNAIISNARAKLKSSGRSVSRNSTKKFIRNQISRKSVTKEAGEEAIRLLDDKVAKEAALRSAKNLLIKEEAAATKALANALKTFAISTPIAALGAAGIAYSWLSSDLDTKVMNCTDTDKGEGCYTSCTKDSLSAPTDDLNTKVFKPIFGKNLCIDEKNNYVLREIKGAGIPTAGAIFTTTEENWAKAKQKMSSDVADKGNCDYNEDDIDVYVGVPLYDSETLLPNENGATSVLIDSIRIDE